MEESKLKQLAAAITRVMRPAEGKLVRIWRWLTTWLDRRQAREDDLEKERRAHLDLEAEEQRKAGVPAAEAPYAALRPLATGLLWEEEVRETWGWISIEQVWQDMRLACRILRKNSGFTAVAVLSLALGIGGNAAIFSIVSAVLIRPLPYPDSDRLVEAANSGYYPPGGLVALQQESRTMDVAGFNPGIRLNLTGQGEAWRLRGSLVSANLFAVLGVGVELGRTFSPGEDHSGQDNLVILSHAMWQDKFAGDPGIIGRVIQLGSVERQVVGVMAPGFAFPEAATQFWIPLHLDPRDPNAYWAMGFMPIIARLRAGATLEQAQREIQSLTRHMITLFPYPMGRDWNAEATVLPLQQFLANKIRAKLIVLQCAIGLVWLISCANVASLLLARATSAKRKWLFGPPWQQRAAESCDSSSPRVRRWRSPVAPLASRSLLRPSQS